MFLNRLQEQNAAFAQAVIDLHQAGELPPDTYVIDLDTLADNARGLCAEAHRLDLDVVAMTKQFGRNPQALQTLRDCGVDSFVAVDMTCARAITRAGQPLGHLGHLVQVPRGQAAEAAAMQPTNWTVFNESKAAEAAAASRDLGRIQGLLARTYGADDVVIETHAGGFAADAIEKVAEGLDGLEGARFAGLTTYPALVFDRDQRRVVATPNLRTVRDCAERLEAAGWNDVVVNCPGETSTAVLSMLAENGATQVEPGHGFTATGAYHAFADLPERPAMLYLSEVSHVDSGTAYCFGGGLYLCVGSVDYSLQALVGRDYESARHQRADVAISQNHQVIDFYGRLTPRGDARIEEGDSVIFCFRAQAFYTRSTVAAISGVHHGNPRVEGLYTVDGRLL